MPLLLPDDYGDVTAKFCPNFGQRHSFLHMRWAGARFAARASPGPLAILRLARLLKTRGRCVLEGRDR
jgi:hypothetical protein